MRPQTFAALDAGTEKSSKSLLHNVGRGAQSVRENINKKRRTSVVEFNDKVKSVQVHAKTHASSLVSSVSKVTSTISKHVASASHHHASTATKAAGWVDEAVVVKRLSVPKDALTWLQWLVSEEDMEHEGNFLLMEPGIIHPRSVFKRWWDFAERFLCFLVILFVPWQVRVTHLSQRTLTRGAARHQVSYAYNYQSMSTFAEAFWAVCMPLSDAVFVTDMLVSCRTAVEKDGELLQSRTRIARVYGRRRLVVDAVAVFGCLSRHVMDMAGTAGKVCSALRIIKGLPLLLERRRRAMTSQSEDGHASVKEHLRLTLIMFVVTHVVACGFNAVGDAQVGGARVTHNWISVTRPCNTLTARAARRATRAGRITTATGATRRT